MPFLNAYSIGTIDVLTIMKDAGLVAATAAATVGGSARQIDLGASVGSQGAGTYWGCVVIDASAIEVGSNDELFTIIVEGCNTSGFGSGEIAPLAMLTLGAGGVIPGAGATSSVAGRYLLPFCNFAHGTIFQYIRLETVVAGTIATGINYTAYLADLP